MEDDDEEGFGIASNMEFGLWWLLLTSGTMGMPMAPVVVVN